MRQYMVKNLIRVLIRLIASLLCRLHRALQDLLLLRLRLRQNQRRLLLRLLYYAALIHQPVRVFFRLLDDALRLVPRVGKDRIFFLHDLLRPLQLQRQFIAQFIDQPDKLRFLDQAFVRKNNMTAFYDKIFNVIQNVAYRHL